jgi:hypothetical protein
VLEGKYEGPDALLTVKGKQFLTYGRDSFPVYCAHEPVMERQDIEAHGAPFVVVEPAHELGKEHCNFIIYKDRSKVPARYYERLGPQEAHACEVTCRRRGFPAIFEPGG